MSSINAISHAWNSMPLSPCLTVRQQQTGSLLRWPGKALKGCIFIQPSLSGWEQMSCRSDTEGRDIQTLCGNVKHGWQRTMGSLCGGDHAFVLNDWEQTESHTNHCTNTSSRRLYRCLLNLMILYLHCVWRDWPSWWSANVPGPGFPVHTEIQYYLSQAESDNVRLVS